MAIATELAFATDECERDRLIEQLTLTLHENALDGPLDDDASELGPLESPNVSHDLAVLSKELNLGGRDDAPAASHALSAPGSYDNDASILPIDPPTPNANAELSAVSAAPALAPNARLPPTAAESEATVSAVADLLQLPASPKRDAPAPAPRAAATGAAALVAPFSPNAPAEPATAAAEGDDDESISTISPDGSAAGGAGAAVDTEAWRVPPKALAEPLAAAASPTGGTTSPAPRKSTSAR